MTDDCPYCTDERICNYHYQLILFETWNLRPGDCLGDPGKQLSEVILAYVETFDVVPEMYEDKFA